MKTTKRQQLAAHLAAVPRAELETVGARLATLHHVRHGAMPQDGLFLLTMEDGVHRDGFYLGEIPVATAVVEVDSPAGPVRGGALLMGATMAQAQAVALCDAVAAHGLDGVDLVESLAQRGAHLRAEVAQQRAQMCAATRVSFSDLSDGDAATNFSASTESAP